MGIKIIATDLDGTLMAPDHLTVTERTRKALFKAHENGVKIAVATGRTLDFIGGVIKQIPFADYVVYSNGASVFDCKAGRDIYRNHINPDDTSEILRFLDGYPVYYNAYVDGKAYYQNNKQRFYKNDDLPKRFVEEFVRTSIGYDRLCEELSGRSAEIFSIYSMTRENETEITDFLKGKKLLLTSSIPNETEASAQNVNKGSALRGMCEKLGVSSDELMAFGDAGNDWHMLKFAGWSFAMGNADEKCKRVAKYTTLSNAEDGVAAAVEKYALNR